LSKNSCIQTLELSICKHTWTCPLAF
jgi:hypothetical protein